MHNGLKLLLAIALPLAVGGMSGWATAAGVATWYPTLVKPPFNPPSWVFGPVWTVLYVMIAVSAWLVWRAQPRFGLPLGLWSAQLALNTIWSWLFFGLERPGLAAVDIIVLLGTIVATAYAFVRVSRLAAVMLLPYALWVGFATALNLALWRLNA